MTVKKISVITIAVLSGIIGFLLFKSIFKKNPYDMPVNIDESKTTPEYGDIYVDSSIGDANLLNPVIGSDSASHEIAKLLFNGLVKYDKDLKLTGDLAERWNISKDGLVITFFLKKGVKWQDGVEFTSDDVEFTFNKLISPDTKSPYKADFELVKEFKKLDRYSFRVSYGKPFAPALESWGMGMLPKHILQGKDINTDKFNRNPVGLGPYTFKVWKSGSMITLENNPNYFEGRPYFNKYVYRVIPDQSVQFMELKNFGIDMMGLRPDMYVKQTNDKWFLERFNKFRYPGNNYAYLGFNLNNPLFSDLRVRQAISFAINKEEIINGVILGLGRQVTGPFAPDSWAYNHEVKPVPCDIEKAASLLKEAGWVDSDKDGILEKDGKKFAFTLMTNQGNKSREIVSVIIQQQLRKIGIKAEVRTIAWNAFIAEYVDKKKFDAVVMGWNLSMDPDGYIIWHSSKTKEGEFNFVSYKNLEVDRLLEEGRSVFDIEKRKKAYNRIHKLIADDLPYVFLYSADSISAVHKRICGIKPAPAGIGYNFIKWYVPKEYQMRTVIAK
jgi:peptide/nickel transport system substrate-binding protein